MPDRCLISSRRSSLGQGGDRSIVSPSKLYGRRAEHLRREARHHPLDHAHDVGVVGERLVALHHGELGVVGQVDALVAEDAPDLVDLLHAAHDEPLEVELGGYAKVQVAVEGVVVRSKGAGRAAGGDGHQHGSLHLHEAPPVHEAPERAHETASHDGDAHRLVVGDQVQVPLAEARLHVRQAVPLLGQGPERLAQDRPLFGLDGDLTRARPEQRPRRADPVPYVDVGERVVRVGELVLPEKDLYLAVAVLEAEECRPPHAAAAHDAARYGDGPVRCPSPCSLSSASNRDAASAEVWLLS